MAATITLDTARNELVEGATRLRISGLQARLLGLLAPLYPVARRPAALFPMLWPSAEVDCENNFSTHVCRLRKAVAGAGLAPLLWTRHGLIGLERPLAVTGQPPDVIPPELGALLRELLWSHPSKTAADRVLAVLA